MYHLGALSLVAALAARAAAQAQEEDEATLPPMSVQTFWLPDSEPASLEAELLSTELVPSPTDDPILTETVAHYRFSCPTARSPENDACRAASIYPADVYHSAGPVWGGTTTYGADDSTTTWECKIGRSGDDTITWGHSGECTKTIVSAGSTRTESSSYNPCYVAAHHVPVIVTKGASLLPSAYYLEYYQEGIAASDIKAGHASEIKENGCPASETIMFAGAAETSSGGDEGSDSTTSGSGTSSGTPTGTGEPAAESSEGGAGGAVSTRQGSIMFGLGAALAVIGVLGL